MKTKKEDRLTYYKYLLNSHNEYWKRSKPLMKYFINAYCSKDNLVADKYASDLGFLEKDTIQTPDAYNLIESYVNTLFYKNPAVVVEGDPLKQNDPKPIETLCNRWLETRRDALEQATRLAILLPMSFLKMCKSNRFDKEEPSTYLEAFDIAALNPWNVILDLDANSWSEQRYVGHTYEMTLTDAKETFEKSFTYTPKQKSFYFVEDQGEITDKNKATPEAYAFVQIIEIYDFVEDKLVIWTPDTDKGFAILLEKEIPVKDPTGFPLAPIIPLYFSWRPDHPLEGISTMKRLWDLIREKNDIRTHQNRIMKQDINTWLYRKDILDQSSIAALEAGEDGKWIPIDGNIGDIQSAFVQIPHAQLSPTIQQVYEQNRDDLQRSTLLGPNSRGESTGDTATEVAIMSQFTESEAGKMARARNQALESLCQYYIRNLRALFAEDSDLKISLEAKTENGKQAIVIGASELDGKFQYSALDGAGTPLTDMVKKQEFNQLLPTILTLGKDPSPIAQAALKELIRMYDLPDTLLVSPQPQQPVPSVETATPTGEVPNAPLPV